MFYDIFFLSFLCTIEEFLLSGNVTLGFGLLHDLGLIRMSFWTLRRSRQKLTLSFAFLTNRLIVAARFNIVEVRWLFRSFDSVTSPVSGSMMTAE
jgi:hypothetical protein